MKIKQKTMKLSRLVQLQDKIELNPMWQRGAAWKPARQALLIDSILREMDIPKIYLRAMPAGSAHMYQAVDGQQRLRAIFEFHSDALKLNHPEVLLPVNGHAITGVTFKQLHKSLRDQFTDFEVSIAEIEQANNDEISNLFSRLQMGVSLNPAELRNALGGAMQYSIVSVARSHEFFEECRIGDTRSKREDFVAHAFAMAAYDGNNDIKAPDLKAMIKQYATGHTDEVLNMSAKVGDALNVLAEVNALVDYRITQKWIFVDLLWLIMQHHASDAAVVPGKLAAAYTKFEDVRRKYNAEPERLIRGKGVTTLDRYLYRYITAFKAQGGTAENLGIRAKALRAFTTNILAR